MKKFITTISLIAAMAMGANAQDFQTPMEHNVCERFFNTFEYEVKNNIAHCDSKNGNVSEYINMAAEMRGQAEALEQRYGKFSTSTKKLAGGTGIGIDTNFENWLMNYRDFLCTLDKGDLIKLEAFLTFRMENTFRRDFEKRPQAYYNSKHYVKWISFLSLNDPRVKPDQLMIAGDNLLHRIFFGYQYQPDDEIKRFVGYIAEGDFLEAKKLVINSKRTNEGVQELLYACSLPMQK